jgi:alkylation response protein AidB-like acyl-CoA dehydrogenase
LWCQGYSEPGAGSDLAAVATSATLDGDQWVITGQKVWTSLAQEADWCFLLARTEPGSRRSAGLSYLLVPMRQPGITVRPIRQLTGTAEFNEVFFDGARTSRANMVAQSVTAGGWPGPRWPSSVARPPWASRSASGASWTR